MNGYRTPKLPRGTSPRGPWPSAWREALAVGALGAALWGGVHGAQALTATHPVKMPVPQPGSRSLKQPLLVDIAVDESGSMADSDPDDERWASADRLVAWIGRYQRQGDRVSVTRFAGDAQHGPLVPARQAANARFSVPDPGGNGTQFLPVAEAADDVFGRHTGRKVVLLITDGDGPDRQQAIADLRVVADRVFVIALDKANHWQAAKAAWEAAGYPVTTVGGKAPNEIGAQLARDLMSVTGQKER